MKKRFLILVAVLTILILVLIFMTIFSFLNKPSNQNYKTVEIRDFSCPGMSGFTFNYPVFKGWKIEPYEAFAKEVNLCDLKITTLNGTVVIMIIQKTGKNYPGMTRTQIGSKIKNSNGVEYSEIKIATQALVPNQKAAYEFYGSDFSMIIGILHTIEFPNEFFRTVIDSFKFTNCSPESIGAKTFSDLKGKIPLGRFGDQQLMAINAVMQKIKENGENPEDFFVIMQIGEKFGLNGYVITFQLMHKDGFRQENCSKVGNPSGKDRIMSYDTNQDKIIRDLLTK